MPWCCALVSSGMGAARAAAEHGAGVWSELITRLRGTLFLVSLHTALGQRRLGFYHHAKDKGGSERLRSCREVPEQMGQGGRF